MNFDYIRMLTYLEIKNFISKMLIERFKTGFVINLKNVKIDSRSYQVEFEAVASNGLRFYGCATCTDFDCEISLNDGRFNTKSKYNKEWAKWMYETLKSKNINNKRLPELYKADYNDYREAIRNKKLIEAKKECESTLLK